ncbi:hypothetical protein BRAS3843_3160043 [Bradyrhizobium sp. STM 3843]|nr:hypothetical protein BRAS3843_3160043 [Bradyrhizobium sp. STM 3843]
MNATLHNGGAAGLQEPALIRSADGVKEAFSDRRYPVRGIPESSVFSRISMPRRGNPISIWNCC